MNTLKAQVEEMICQEFIYIWNFFFLSENHLTLPLFAPILRVISYSEPKGGTGGADL